MKLGRVFAGIGMRGHEPQHQRLIDCGALVGQVADRSRARLEPMRTQRGQRRLDGRPRQPNYGYGSATGRGGEGEDGVGHQVSSPYHWGRRRGASSPFYGRRSPIT